MADISTTLIEPAELTSIARLLLAEEDRARNVFSLQEWFPATLTDKVRYESFRGTDRTYTDAAMFRAWTTPSRPGTRPGVQYVRGEIPPISIHYSLTEQDQLRLRELIGSGADANQALTDDIINDVGRGVKAIRNAMEVISSKLLTDASFTLSENGLNLDVDAGRSANNESSVTTSWATAATATPLDDELAVMEVMDAENFGPGDLVAVMNRTTWNLFKATTQVRSAFPSFRVLDVIRDADINQVRIDADLPPVQIHRQKVKNSAGTLVDVIPDNKVIYLPSDQYAGGKRVGSTQYAVPVIADRPEINLDLDNRPGPVAYTTESVNPSMITTVIDAVGLPILEDPNATYCLTTTP